MANNPNTPPPPDDLPDPVEVELVAFLDGELEPSQAHDVEAKLAADASLRARAAALKKTFDLLGYLPQREPSPEFATRTLDKLPAAKSGTAAPSYSGSGTRPASPSSSVPIPLPPASRGWAWAVGLAAATVFALAGGYFGMAAARNYFHPPAKETATGPEEEAPPDRVARNLPLYAVADDLDFVVHLADDPMMFDDEAMASGSELKIPWTADVPMLARAFQTLPQDRQKQILKLDQQLFALDAKERDRLLRALEAYGAWLDRLPEAERRGVMAQATPKLRLRVIHDIRENQAREAIPEFIRNIPDPDARTKRIKQWEDDEADRRRAWAFAREHWESIRGTRTPWPFDNEELKKKVIEYARTAYRFEDKKTSRLLPADTLRLAEAYREGEKDSWLWFGWVLYDLTPRYEPRDGVPRYEMFPEPADGKHITDFHHLPPQLEKHYANKPQIRQQQRFAQAIGKWPDFPLAIHNDITNAKLAFAASALGPARVQEFAEPARGFVNRELFPVLTWHERLSLEGTEGRWPEYPRLLIRATRAHDLSIPGVMLPGKPSDWDRTYGGVPGRAAIRSKGNPLP